jgi:hypothetical protein
LGGDTFTVRGLPEGLPGGVGAFWAGGAGAGVAAAGGAAGAFPGGGAWAMEVPAKRIAGTMNRALMKGLLNPRTQPPRSGS